MPNEGVRGYIRTLREARLQADTARPSIYSQRRFGAAIGLSERAYIDWETGETKTLKTGPLLKALAILAAPWDDAAKLDDATYEEGAAMATQLATGQRPPLPEDPEVLFEQVVHEHLSQRLSAGDRELAEGLIAGLRVLLDRARQTGRTRQPRDEGIGE